MEYPIEAASGVHFSGLRPDGLLVSPASSPASSSSQRVLSSIPVSPGDLSAPPKQPFVIGNVYVIIHEYMHCMLHIQIILFLGPELGDRQKNRSPLLLLVLKG